MASGNSGPSNRSTHSRQRPVFSARSAEEDAGRLAPSETSPETVRRLPSPSENPYQPMTAATRLSPRNFTRTSTFFDGVSQWFSRPDTAPVQRDLHTASTQSTDANDAFVEVNSDQKKDRARTHDLRASMAAQSSKLGTFSGVFVPTTLNVLSILMFLRFGFVLGQSGVLGMMGMLVASYIIDLLTTMSISAIATNGTVRGGGAYYLISRSLGPEFGGSIGIVFYMGLIFNTGMNALGLVDCMVENFGVESGSWSRFLLEGFWWNYLWGSIVLLVCTAICFAGSSIFARASNGLLAILLISTFSIPLSGLIQQPFKSTELGVEFTGFRTRTFLENLKPHLTKGAAGSQLPHRENFQDLFGILFPATSGIFAGANMSGDLKNPSRSIPTGTLSGLLLTFFTYTAVILSMAASITRQSFYNNVNVIQVTNVSETMVLLGEFAASFFSSLSGLIGAAKLLQAISRDNLVPGLSLFGKASTKSDDPILAIIFSYVVAQITMLFDINKIASFTAMTYLMTFLAINLACFLLKIGSAPNFRPSFHYFNWVTAALGAVFSLASMFFVDGVYATGCIIVLVFLFVLIHYTSPPKSWGDVSQSLIYHQVRKYLLRLKQEHVKFWRPQILLFVNDMDAQYKMVHFCNSLKKGALFVLGHVIVTDDFTNAVPEARRRQVVWTKFIEYSKVKAFTNITVAPTAEWGVRNIVLNSGLGGMRPNIVIIDQYRPNQSIGDIFQRRPRRRHSKSVGVTLTRQESDPSADETDLTPSNSAQTYITILEDLLFKLRINVAVAKGFENLELPNPRGRNEKTFIDLWPIQMSAELAADRQSKQNVLTTNFDTYTLILQLGCILNTVPSWKKSYKLRVAVFVEYESDVEEERGRVSALLEKLRIEAKVLVYCLAGGELQTYQIIVNGDTSSASEDVLEDVNTVLKDESWWHDIQDFRDKTSGSAQRPGQSSRAADLLGGLSHWPVASFQQGAQRQATPRFGGIKNFVRSNRQQRRRSISSFRGLSVNMGMQTSRLLDAMVNYQSDDSEDSSTTEDEEQEPYVSDSDDGSTTPRTGAATPVIRTVTDTPENMSPSHTSVMETLSAQDEAAEEEAGNPTDTLAARPQISSLSRPMFSRAASGNRFSSSPIPETRVNQTEDTGPSIMFSDSPPPRRTIDLASADPPSQTHESIYTHHHRQRPESSTPASSTAASGFPNQAAMPLSFNDLPCRAQHLILNELITRHSHETAVMFTTLPSPIEGTCLDNAASEAYVSDMEILCRGLPPCLLVHSNSMTVTMNL
ncbi:cation chloride cotransporter, putative [Talaromyces stipitatus ATCC 10500]|uniref:Cation chloride cotransporter, putative n=1 Tax=Talaromyces stipitatus (strain ATCC 10500 / CBS 375.48 / QM 6759 / NRRL 1006) TaxID=441959 RepID=B8MK78_TALSN|nr:cation chloride cotransporter, putative [Talaromyces stipitatus ATCC 10500]EED15233.1 cation chloride cotransporter, putative [Talaromyces stipitatus ATCC 10500]